MDCGSSADGKEGTALYELERGQLYADPHVRPIYCHVTPLLWQEPPPQRSRTPGHCCGFAAVGSAARSYRSTAARPALTQPAMSPTQPTETAKRLEDIYVCTGVRTYGKMGSADPPWKNG